MNRKVLVVIIIIIVLLCGLTSYFNYNNDIKNVSNEINSNKSGNINSGDINNTLNIRNFDGEDVDLIGEKTIINDLTTVIPDRYTNGTIKKSSGIETYGKYDDDSIYITVYNNSSSGNKVYQGDIDYFAYGIANKDNSPRRESITIANHTILYVNQHSDTRGDYRLAFFEVSGKKVLIEWLGTEVTENIKNIINGFYKLN